MASLHTRFRRWAKDGPFARMLQAAQAEAAATGDIDWLVSIDQHRPRPPARHRGTNPGGATRPSEGPGAA
ncbi:hypothetical protein [Streptomyces smyrnaeus]|uniref:hypothetical protein n=1 Tax=Streptomyces smyrnaeus TaxID=1387713 RepID=UPI0033E0AF88